MIPAPLDNRPAPPREERRAAPTLTSTGRSGMTKSLDSMLWLSVLFAACECSWVIAWLVIT